MEKLHQAKRYENNNKDKYNSPDDTKFEYLFRRRFFFSWRNENCVLLYYLNYYSQLRCLGTSLERRDNYVEIGNL